MSSEHDDVLFGPGKYNYVMRLENENARDVVKDRLKSCTFNFYIEDILMWVNWTTKGERGDDVLNKLKDEKLITKWGEDNSPFLSLTLA